MSSVLMWDDIEYWVLERCTFCWISEIAFSISLVLGDWDLRRDGARRPGLDVDAEGPVVDWRRDVPARFGEDRRFADLAICDFAICDSNFFMAA